MNKKRECLFINSKKSFALDELVNQLLFEILIKLPVKSAHRCKAVSKRWNSLISDSYFSREYTLRRPKYSPSQFTFLRNPGINHNDLFKHHGFSMDFLPTSKLPFIIGSCNGLVLCEEFLKPRPLYICNPLTMQWLAIPPAPFPYSGIGFACDIKDQEFSSKTEYNVVCIHSSRKLKNDLKVGIFSLDTMEWSKLELHCPSEIYTETERFCSSNLICCNGMLYWVLDYSGIIEYDLYNRIDQCGFIDFPEASWKNRFFGTCQDRLRLCQIGPSDSSLKVWELVNGKTSEWRLEHNICLQDLVIDGEGVRSWSPMVVAVDAVDQDVVHVYEKTNRLYSCNLRNKTAKSNGPSVPFSPFVLPWWPTPLPCPQLKSSQ